MVSRKFVRTFSEVNRELWLVLSIFAIALVLNMLVSQHRMVLGFYTIPTVFSAYFYGRRHAISTAFFSTALVILITYFNPTVMSGSVHMHFDERWYDITVWSGTLIILAYAMGTLYEKQKVRERELRDTYNGVLMILRQFISKDQYTQNHSYRVSVYAVKIAQELRLGEDKIEDVRAAALLHDIGKLDISRDILYKAAKLTHEEYEEIKSHVSKGISMLEPVGGSLRRVLPIILAHHDRWDGAGYNPSKGDEIPLEARIIAVADAYDAMTSDRPYRKALPTFEAVDLIQKESGKGWDPRVVDAFTRAFNRREMEVPELVL